jgi:hypothetical protein
MRWGLRAGVVLSLLIGAFGLQQQAYRQPQANLLSLAPLQFAGFYGLESSDTLPGSAGAARRSLRWTAADSAFTINPRLAGNGVIRMEYLIPPPGGTVQIALNQQHLIDLVPAPALRVAHLFVPPGTDIALHQTSPFQRDGRELGMIATDIQWVGVSGPLWQSGLRLPCTLGLLGLLGWLCGWRWWLTGSLGLAMLVSVGMIGRWLPWDSLAMQPALQQLLGAACLGAGMWRLGRRLRWASAGRWLALGWCILTVLFWTPRIDVDGVGYYAYVRSLLVDGDLRFANEFDPALTPLRGNAGLASAATPTGYTPNPWSIGPALVWTPFWLIGDGLTWVGQQAGSDWQRDGYAPPYIHMTMFASALAGLLTLIGAYRLAQRWVTPEAAALIALTIYLGSSLLFYAQLEGSFAHSLTTAASTWFILASFAVHEAPTRRSWLRLGLSGGLMILLYWISAILVIFPALLLLPQAIKSLGQRQKLIGLAAGAASAGAVALLVFVPQMLIWNIVYGSWLTIPQGSSFVTPGTNHLATMLGGSLYGMVWWTPALLVGLLGIGVLALRQRWLGLVCGATVVIYLLYNARLPDWHGSGGFGLRRMTTLTPLAVMGLAALAQRLRRWPQLLAASGGALAVWGLHMLVRYATYQLPHGVYELLDLPIRAIIFPPQAFPAQAARDLAANGFIGRLIQSPTLAASLTLASCGVILGGVLWAWRHEQRRQVRMTKPSHGADEV